MICERCFSDRLAAVFGREDTFLKGWVCECCAKIRFPTGRERLFTEKELKLRGSDDDGNRTHRA